MKPCVAAGLYCIQIVFGWAYAAAGVFMNSSARTR